MLFISVCALPSIQFKARAFCAKHVVFPHSVHMVNFLQFSDRKVENKTDQGIKR